MKRRWPPKVFATSHAVSAAYGLLCKIATPGQDVRASGTHGMDAVCTAVAWIVVDFRRLLAALSACDRNKNFGRADLLLRYSNYLHINHITINNNISPLQTGLTAVLSAPYLIYPQAVPSHSLPPAQCSSAPLLQRAVSLGNNACYNDILSDKFFW